MKILIFIILLTSTLFSQKLWEIQVNPEDLLKDVIEIPNSDLLLFTYNTGKIEIRRSEDGSLVKNVTTPQGELGSYSISGLGNSYYFSERSEYIIGNNETKSNDTIFVYDLLSDEIVNRISFEIEGFENKENIKTKQYRYNITPDMTKIYGKIAYHFKEPVVENYELYHSKVYFYVYDLLQNKIVYFERCNISYIDEQGRNFSTEFHLDSYRSSPDSKYIILNGREFSGKYNEDAINAAKMFNVEINEMSISMTNKNTNSEKLGVLDLKYNRFINSDLIISGGFSIYKFPDITLVKSINLFTEFGLFASLNNETKICENNLFCRVGERIENTQNKYYRYYLYFDFNDKSIFLNTKSLQTSLEFSRMFLIKDCQKIIVVKDFDNRDGIIVCYDYNTLDVETQNTSSSYFSKSGLSINFNSQEFIGKPVKIEIYNSVGAKVGTLYNEIINQPDYNFQIPELPSGAYYLQCQLPNNNLNFNFVVVR